MHREQLVRLWLSVFLCNSELAGTALILCVSQRRLQIPYIWAPSLGASPWEQTRSRGCAWGLHTWQGGPETESAGSILNQQPKKMMDKPTPSGAVSPPFPRGSLWAYRCPHGSLLFFFFTIKHSVWDLSSLTRD